jgi:hypothetical protein
MATVPSFDEILTNAASLSASDFNESREQISALASLLYEAYRAYTGGVSLASGGAIPEWDALRPDIQEAWRASASAALIYATCRADVMIHRGFSYGL